jgi:hypothetical protein
MSLPRMKLLSLLLSGAALLAACGGGTTSASSDVFGAQLAASLASGQVATGSLGTPVRRLDAGSIVAPSITDDQLFDWAEARYPELFPKGPKTVGVNYEGVSYRVRHYLSSGNFLGTVQGGTVYGLGPATKGELLQLGSIESYICQVVPDSCGAAPEQLSRVWIDAGGLQCTPGSGASLMDTRRRLTDAGVPVAASSCGGNPDGVAPAMCGASDMRTYIFDIDARAQEAAVKLGFRVAPVGYKPISWACSY